MAERRKIGIIYRYDENWIGGTYYIQNLIAALNKLPRSELYDLVIFTEDDSQFSNLQSFTKYPFLTKGNYVIKLPLVKRIINRIGRLLYDKNIFSVFNKDIDLVFPAEYLDKFRTDQKFLYWIPDFQEHYLPTFFPIEEIVKRKRKQGEMLCNGSNIVFSSQSAKNDFNEIYPLNSLKQYVLNFAVTHPALRDANNVIIKFNLPDRFFICCNQFWKHKNHIVIIRAIHQLKIQGHVVFVAFTGREHDDRHPDFFTELMNEIKSLGLEDNVAFLGFISREDQLRLMKKSVAVLQPSLFEGWSTVIEDAKALKIKIIASDICVHREQLSQYGSFALFSAAKEEELAKLILSIEAITPNAPDYEKNVTSFAEDFKIIVDKILTT